MTESEKPDADTRSDDDMPLRKRAWFWAVVVVLVGGFLVQVFDNPASDDDQPASSSACDGLPPQGSFTMPSLNGLGVAEARAKVLTTYLTALKAHDACDIERGYSQNTRESSAKSSGESLLKDCVKTVGYTWLKEYPANDWATWEKDKKGEVVSTSPREGAQWKWCDDIRLFTLTPAEIAWYDKNPTMPRIERGTELSSLFAANGRLRAVGDLTVPLDEKKTEQFGFDRGFITRAEKGIDPDPRVEPTELTQARAGHDLEILVDYKIQTVVRTIPASGEPLRLGQPILILIHEENRPAPPGSGTGQPGSGGFNPDGDVDADPDGPNIHRPNFCYRHWWC